MSPLFPCSTTITMKMIISTRRTSMSGLHSFPVPRGIAACRDCHDGSPCAPVKTGEVL